MAGDELVAARKRCAGSYRPAPAATDADDWLIRKGYQYGLCQTLSHDIWHFELATEPGTKCPPPKDPED